MATVSDTITAINAACRAKGGVYSQYSCQSVSWDDVSRGTVGGSLSCWGANITDTRLWAKDGRQLFTVRSNNWNEKLGAVSSNDIAVVTGNHVNGGEAELRPVTLKQFLANLGTYGNYVGLPSSADMSKLDLDQKVSIRFQTTFLPVGEEEHANMEFCSEAYNYNTKSDADPRNLVVLCTSQGLALQQDGSGAQRLFHHAVDKDGKIHRYWLEAERSRHKVGGPQVQTDEERASAAARGKATSSVIGVRAMGTRFNVLMNIQIPLAQAPPPARPKTPPKGVVYKGIGGFSSKGKGGPQFMAEALTNVEDLMSEYNVYQDAVAAEEGEFEEEKGEYVECVVYKDVAPCAPRARSCKMPKAGSACAARVSRGAEVDIWKGLTVKEPKRHSSEHVTCTVVIYNAISGGVPSETDVVAAIDDLEQLYAACNVKGNLADQEFDFMKKELTVNDAVSIADKLSTQPYKPPTHNVIGHDVFPM